LSLGRDELAARCGARPEDVGFLADMYQRGTATIIGWGVQRHPFGGQNVRYIDALAWLSGNVGASGTGVYFNLSSVRNLNLSWLPEPSGNRRLRLPMLGRDMEAAIPRVNAAWVSGCNIVNQGPDSGRLAETFSRLDFLVVVDAFMTDTAACAEAWDRLFPTSIWTSSRGGASLRRRAIPSPSPRERSGPGAPCFFPGPSMRSRRRSPNIRCACSA
jgi:anaerobic selenocysteine-containing dehydrogenase